MVVGLPGKAQIGAPIFWTVVKGISILGSYVGCAHTPLFHSLGLIVIVISQEPTRRTRSTRYRRFGQGEVPPRGQAVGGVIRVRLFFFILESWPVVYHSFSVYEGMEQGKIVGRIVLNME